MKEDVTQILSKVQDGNLNYKYRIMKNLINKTAPIMLAILLMAPLLWTSCKEDIGITAARQGEKPNTLKNLAYEEAPGGAKISYDLPTSADLRYVKATYTLENGKEMVTKASIYDNQLAVQGYAAIGEHEVKLVAVSVGDVESDPVTIKIKTGKPNYIILAESFKSNDFFYSTFGGVNLKFENKDAANIILSVFKYGENPTTKEIGWNVLNETYTKSKEGVIRVRGEQPIATTYGIVIRDQWGNVSDTVRRNLTPQEEYEINNLLIYNGITAYSDMNRNGDYISNYNAQSGSAEMQVSLFDGIEGSPYYITNKQWWGKAAPIPFQFTLDARKKAQVSRVKLWGRNDNYGLLFQATHPKEFELYGSNSPAQDGSWDSWTLLGTFEGIRPSGLAFGTNANSEDQDYARKGEDFEVNWDNPSGFKYFRIKVNCTWNGVREQPLGNALTVAISELKLYGKYVD
jgi:hypothetical protein